MVPRAQAQQCRPMNIAVLGASGKTGGHLVGYALQRGHRVRAIMRREPPAPSVQQNVDVAIADVRDHGSMVAAVSGCDAAVWAVGGHDIVRSLRAGHRRQQALCADGTRIALSAFASQQVGRFVVISSWGVGDSRHRVPVTFRAFMMPVLLRAELADKQRQEELVRASDVTWTIVRPSRLTDDDRTGYRVGTQLRYSATSSTSRRSVAEFVIRCIDEGSYCFETVEISGERAK